MIKKIDHVVITTSLIDETLEFYQKIGFRVNLGNSRYELFAGDFKINVHILGKEMTPHAQKVQEGSADFCFEISGSIKELKENLISNNIDIELGIVDRNGVKGAMKSIYLRDPNGNLIEFCSYE